jgi:alpha-galactosidase
VGIPVVLLSGKAGLGAATRALRTRRIAGALLGVSAFLIPAAAGAVTLQARGIEIELDSRMHSRVVAVLDGNRIELGPSSPSETVTTDRGEQVDFALVDQGEESVSDAIGTGRRHRLVGRSSDLEKTLEVIFYDDWPRVAVMRSVYSNRGAKPIRIESWSQNHYAIAAAAGAPEPAFWSYQSGSYEKRPDWVLPLKVGFRQDNFQGMNAPDYGGGTPVADVWRRDVGLAVGHLELVPKSVSLPVARPTRDRATLGVHDASPRTLAPGERLTTLRTFVAVHRGDYFETLGAYRRLMLRQGVRLPAAPAAAFEPIWCAWGYGREFTPEQVLATIPVAKKLGFGWVTLDDGWQVAEGDWSSVPSKFPRGDADMKDFVDRVHAAGMRAQLWWTPLAADPGSRTLRDHPEWLLRNRDGSTRKISWWDSFYLCPALRGVREDAQAFVRKALGEWGFDGLKIDGQHLNGAPPCYDAAHGHATPEDAPEGVPGFFRAIWDEAIATRADAVVEICPCGTAYSFFTLPYLNMTVASDPESSWQVRLKGKTLKALHGDSIAYFGDHVELSTGGEDFASTLGVGGVVGTNFAWPGAPGKKDRKLLLTREREEKWAFWVKLYREKRLSAGEYLGTLYDIGFDRPETHAIRKGDVLYYAFFANRFAGKVELRGLENRRYRVRDYETGRDLGSVDGPKALVALSFRHHELVEAVPEQSAIRFLTDSPRSPKP